MLSRRMFAGCGICSALGLVATAVGAQAQPAGLTRKELGRIDYPDGKVSILMTLEVAPNMAIARHTHPGIESSVVTEGAVELQIGDQPARRIAAGEGFQVPAGVPHSGRNGPQVSRLAITYVVEKDQPLTSPGLMPDFALETAAGGRVAGVDEAGRGPLAGPVLAAAVVFPRGLPTGLAALLDDSKKLTAAAREAACAALQAAAARGEVEFAIGAASAAEIGRLNILRASHLAMRRAVLRLASLPGLALVDGNQPPPLPCPVRCVVGGDALSFSIAAASILAKVVRDRAMARLDPRWPAYGFARHAGYPTARHRAALALHGPCPHHRGGFAPVDQAALRFG